MNAVTVRFEVRIAERKDFCRMIVIEERDGQSAVKGVYEGARSFLSASMKSVLADYMEDATLPLQTWSLPQYVKDYFGTRSIEMRRERDLNGFSFHGPNLSILIKTEHADRARKLLCREIRRKLSEQKK